MTTKFPPLVSAARWLLELGRRIFRFILSAIVILFGGLLVLLSIQLFRIVISTWGWSSFIASSCYALTLVAMLNMGLIFLVAPLKSFRAAKAAIKALLIPLEGFQKIGGYYSGVLIIYLLLLSTVYTLLFALNLVAFSLSWKLNDNTALYVVFCASSLFFTYSGQRAIRLLLGKNTKKTPWILSITQPSLVRVAFYSITAIVYIIANLENFSGFSLVLWSWWITLKEVIVEVLLTYVAIDGALIASRDHQDFLKNILKLEKSENMQ